MPLNPRLFNLVQNRLGAVIVAHEGAAMQYTTPLDPRRPGKRDFQIISPGEYYRVCCPYCGDTRHRLWINHMYGTPDPNGFPMFWPAHCYNENCLADTDKRQHLASTIFQLQNRYDRPPQMRIAQGLIENQVLGEVPLPGEIVSIGQLPPEHEARVYLQDRGFSIQQLVDQYAVGYCLESELFRMLAGRIFVPIVRDRQMVGWQGRLPFDMPKDQWRARRLAKYWTMPLYPRRLWLYNFDTAKNYPFLALVEGVTDVWAMGPYAVALLGKTITPAQSDLLQRYCRDKPIFIVLDATADVNRNQVRDIIHTLSDVSRAPVIPVTLPEGTDPGSFTPEANMRFIYATAAQAGVQLPQIADPSVAATGVA